MKATTTAVLAAINAARAAPDAEIAIAECFTFTLATGVALTWTNVDLPVTYNGITFSATGPLVQGLKYKGSVGLEVDKQQIIIAARPTDLISGNPVSTPFARALSTARPCNATACSSTRSAAPRSAA